MPRSLFAAAVAALLVSSLLAQAPNPVGRTNRNAQPLKQVASIAVTALDRAAINYDDEQRAINGEPARFAMPTDVAVNPNTHGTWEQLDPTWSLWRLRIQCPDANHVNLGFQQFQMPAGAHMQVYSYDYADIVRPFDANDQQPTGQLWTPVVQGDEIVCEVYVQTAQIALVQLDLMRIGSGYRYFGAGDTALGNDGSGSCNVDVNCPQGAPWSDEIPAIAVMSSNGSLFCSGSMINNTGLDGRNFFLTAYHCGVGPAQAPSVVCYWNYERSGCSAGSAPLNQFTTGTAWRAGYSNSDFTLLELNQAPNPAWGITYAGWNRSTANSTSAVAIHHPSGDAKKISFENQSTTTTSYGGVSQPGDGTHLRVTDWDLGTTEGGSSGSPLFDQNHRIIGQLHGGAAACGNNASDWYGRFSRSWTGGGSSTTRLSNWLDPIGTGAVTLDTFTGGDVAVADQYGQGCYETWGTFAEQFAANTFDLAGFPSFTVTIRLEPTSNGYDVVAAGIAGNVWFNPTTPDLGLADDDVSTQTLPWTFPFPGGQTNQAGFCTNGYVWLSGSNVADFSPTIPELVGGPPRLCPVWVDLNPAAGGTCHYDLDPSGNTVYFTWNNVPAYTPGPAGAGNSVQIAMHQSGLVEYRYRQVPNQPNTAITGWTRGFTATPPLTNIGSSMPFAVSVDLSPLTWTPINRPIIGTTQVMTLGNVPMPTSTIGLVLFGGSGNTFGLDLGFVGAAGCNLYVNTPSIDTIFPIANPSVNWLLPIPNTMSLIGSKLFTQGALLVPPGTNPLGALTANGVELTFGDI